MPYSTRHRAMHLITARANSRELAREVNFLMRCIVPSVATNVIALLRAITKHMREVIEEAYWNILLPGKKRNVSDIRY